MSGSEALPVLTLPGASGARPLSAPELDRQMVREWAPHSASLSSVFHEWLASALGLKALQALGSGLTWCLNGGGNPGWAEPRKVERRAPGACSLHFTMALPSPLHSQDSYLMFSKLHLYSIDSLVTNTSSVLKGNFMSQFTHGKLTSFATNKRKR